MAGSSSDSHGGAAVLDIDPFSLESLKDYHPIDEAVRETDELVWIERYGFWATGRYDVVESVFRDYERFASTSGTGLTNTKQAGNWRRASVLLENDPPSHTKYRRIMASIMSPRVVRRLQEGFQQRADEIVDEALARAAGRDGIVDAAKEIAEAFPLAVLPDAVGFSKQGREHLLTYSNLNFQSMGPRDSALYLAAVESSKEASEFVNWQMRRENLEPGGLGHTIYGYVDEGEIDEEDAGMLVRSFLSAGIDTTIFGIQFSLIALSRYPEAWRALSADPGLARAVFEEALRWNPPSPFFGRTTTRDMEFLGKQLGEGEKVVVFVGAANRDPRHWERPDDFDLGRDAAGHLAFGTGVHGCVGQMMARMEAACVLNAVARKVGSIEEAGEPEPFYSSWLRGFEHLPMRITPKA